MLQKQFPRFSSELSWVTDTTGTTGILKKVLAREKCHGMIASQILSPSVYLPYLSHPTGTTGTTGESKYFSLTRTCRRTVKAQEKPIPKPLFPVRLAIRTALRIRHVFHPAGS
jgi:hypothetical protein